LKLPRAQPIKFLKRRKHSPTHKAGMTSTPTLLALGSNLTPRYQMLVRALEALHQADGVVVRRCSKVYETRALLPEDAPKDWGSPFLNMAALVHTSLDPESLLATAKSIEGQLGRQARGHWGPREIDIDLIDMQGITRQSKKLNLPHAHWKDRPFVFLPVADIDPEWVITGEARPVKEWAEAASRVDILHTHPAPEVPHG